MPPLVEELPPDVLRYREAGEAALARRDGKAALEAFDRVLALAPGLSEIHYGRGRALFSLGDFQAALESYDRALALTPAFAEAHNFRGACLGMLGDAGAARDGFERAIALKPDYPEAHFNLGVFLGLHGDMPGSLESLDRAIALKPEYAVAWVNRGVALEFQGLTREAIDCYEQALALYPDIPGAMPSRDGRWPAAPNSSTQRPSAGDYVLARHNRSLCLLSLGLLSEGWQEYEWRWGSATGKKVSPHHPIWTGAESLEGKTILVFSEQGIGDNIQFCRYIPLLEERGAKVLYGLGPKFEAFAGLLKGIGAPFRFIDGSQPLDHQVQYDYQCAVMSLPWAFGTELGSIPPPMRGLSAPAALVSAWKKRLGREGFRIGISWQGNPSHQRDRERSFPLALFSEIAAIPGVRLINLHKGAGEAQISQVPFKVENFSSEISLDAQGWLDTAALASACDLVICCDTALAHLAGTLGLPVWLLVTHAADWRWFKDRTDSPWYPSLRIFRQREYGNWPSVFEELREPVNYAVSVHAEGRALTCSAPPSSRPASRRWLSWLRS